MRLADLDDAIPDPWLAYRQEQARKRREVAKRDRMYRDDQDDDEDPIPEGPGNARLRIFVCGHCSTAEVVPWCGQAPDCGHPACADALARCAARHQLDGRRFHGPVSVILIDSHLWDGHDQAADKAG